MSQPEIHPRVHPGIAPLAFLVGTWKGPGHGQYPTIPSFDYTEQVEIAPLPKPVLRYTQRTAEATSGEPRHVEAGFFRLPEPGSAELVIAQPTGVVEAYAGVHESVQDGGGRLERLVLRSVFVGTTPAAVEVTQVERVIEVRGDVLTYRLAMAAVGQPLTHHLAAELHRVV